MIVPVFLLLTVPALALLAAVHWYVWRRLVRDLTVPRGTARRAGTAAVIVLPLLSLGAFGAGQTGAPFLLQQVLAWPGYLWTALLLYLVLALVVGEAVRPLLLRAPGGRSQHRPQERRTRPQEGAGPVVGLPAAETPAETPAQGPAEAGEESAEDRRAAGPPRRLFVSRVVGGAAAATAVGVVGHGAWGVLRGPTVKRVTVPLAKLPRSAHGYRIAVVSDIHLGPVLGRAHTQRVVDAVNATQPDLVAIVGDLVDGSVADLGGATEPLARLRSRDGSYFVTGNHEYYSGVGQWVERVRDLGVHPLRNERVEIAGFVLAGVNDITGEDYHDAPDYDRALGDRDRSLAAVLLAHQPVMVHEAVRHGVDLQLSGHTHGGQLWPGNLVAALSNPTVAGLDRYGDTQLYVSRGAGAWGPPVRVGAPADITVVQLASRQT
ncbi:metallophosphoesterase [Streptomyces sp. NPDC049954]|uniref:metallophosphoesterase n=1 Tax=Streptomyces sp. NPDC049954 TaxID=3155779 RepID=UPI00341EBE3D